MTLTTAGNALRGRKKKNSDRGLDTFWSYSRMDKRREGEPAETFSHQISMRLYVHRFSSLFQHFPMMGNMGETSSGVEPYFRGIFHVVTDVLRQYVN